MGWQWIPALILAVMGLGLPAGAGALSVDQVIALKKAGVSEQTIRKMIQTEIKVRSMGGVGSYAVRQKGGGEWIVYEAASPRGVVDYPWDPEQNYPAANLGEVVTVLGAARPSPPQAKPAAQSTARPVAKSPAKGYTLHLSSYQDQAGAQKQAAKLTAKGVQARVEPVDIPGKGHWHRVLVGEFSSQDQAQSVGERLSKSGSISSYRVMPR